MKRQYYKIGLLTIFISLIVYILMFSWWVWDQSRLDKSHLAPDRYDVIVANQNRDYSFAEDLQLQDTPDLPFLLINSISFSTDEEYLYIKFNLEGELPKADKTNLNINGNSIESINYKLYLDENYFDFSGNRNPGGPEAILEISPYGIVHIAEEGKLSVPGELLKGGPGFAYFVVRYPYYSILINQISENIVFSAESYVSTSSYPEGIVFNYFESPLLEAESGNPRNIMIDLTIKNSKAQTVENIRY